MPYSGIEPGSETEKKLEKCVEDVLAQHEGEKDFDESNAIAICRASMKAEEAVHSTTLSPVTPEDITRWGNHPAFAGQFELSEILACKGAVLARTERNANGDLISRENLDTMAQTLRFMALDADHQQDKVIGWFATADVKDDTDGKSKLVTDAVIYAKRFPAIAEEIGSGKRHLSIEAMSTEVHCSVCDAWYQSTTQYCTHLQPLLLGGKLQSNVSRGHKGMRAIGGGAVLYPAGTATTFGGDFMVIAHVADPLETGQEDVTEAGEDPDNITQAEIQEDDDMSEQVEQLQTELTAAQVRVGELEGLVQQHEAAAATALVTSRQVQLQAVGMPGDRIDALGDNLGTMQEQVFAMLLDLQREMVAKVKASAAEPEVTKEEETPSKVVASVAVGDEDPPSAPGDPFAVLNMEV